MTPERGRPDPSRAERVRQKRQQTSQERVNSARPQVAHPAPQTTHTTRRTSPYATPNTQTYRTTPKRKVYYAHGANGVEIRMPALPVVKMNWQLASAFFAISLLVLVLLFTNLDAFQAKNVEVNGIQRISVADIQAVVDNNNRSIFTLDRQKTINAVEIAFPELTGIQLKVSFPNKVILTVRERQPILAWSSGDTIQWVDSEGVVMPVRGDAGTLLTIQSSVTAPLTISAKKVASIVDFAVKVYDEKTTPATPEESIQYIDPQVLAAAISLSAQMPEGTSLIYDPIAGMGWNDSRGWEAFFGIDLSNIQIKQVEYQAIIDRLTQSGITPRLISVAHVDAPYYRTE